MTYYIILYYNVILPSFRANERSKTIKKATSIASTIQQMIKNRRSCHFIQENKKMGITFQYIKSYMATILTGLVPS